MKGTLHKIERGWVVKQVIKEGPEARLINQYPILDHGYVNGPGLSDSHEGAEVEFEIVANEGEPLGTGEQPYKQYAKLVDNWLTMKEGDITVNFKPMPEFDEPISLLNSIRANSSWDTIFTDFHIATQQVEKGAPPLIFECWLVDNYNPPTKK